MTNSLTRLSSGLRINSAADDASGLAIADSLKSQANALGQAIRNANDAVGIIQIADNAMDEQIKILDSIKVKATQAAQDGQSEISRKNLQRDIMRLMEELDNIAGTTMYNGQSLLSGNFTNKSFQIGGYSSQTIRTSIGATSSDKIGHVRYETGHQITASGEVTLKFMKTNGLRDVLLESVKISTSAGTGLGTLAEVINKNSELLDVKASWSVETTGKTFVRSGTVQGLSINGIQIGTVNDITKNDRDGKLVAAINDLSDKHGVIATIDERGHLILSSEDGRGIRVSSQGASGISSVLGLSAAGSQAGAMSVANRHEFYGRLTLTRLGQSDISISGTGVDVIGFENNAQRSVNLRDIKGGFSVDEASAMGIFKSIASSQYEAATVQTTGNGTKYRGQVGIGAGVTTLEGAMGVMDIAEAAMVRLDTIRADLGSVQNQLYSTINNISVTQVNLKAAESQIREIDFAQESAAFSKLNILVQAGNYALSQSLQTQQIVLRLLQ
jgi:flagellin